MRRQSHISLTIKINKMMELVYLGIFCLCYSISVAIIIIASIYLGDALGEMSNKRKNKKKVPKNIY